MKRILTILSIAILSLTACEKVYINGDLDGMWRLQKVEKSDTTEYPQEIYYSFQRHMVQVGKYYYEGLPLRYIGNLDYTGDTLKIGGFRKFLEEEKAATAQALETFFLYDTETVFTVDKLNSEMLIITSERGRYILKKW